MTKIEIDGHKKWPVVMQRIDGPVVRYSNGDESWYKNGLLHRTDGPAINWANESVWYVNGKEIDIKPILERFEISPDWKSWTEEEKFLVRLALP